MVREAEGEGGRGGRGDTVASRAALANQGIALILARAAASEHFGNRLFYRILQRFIESSDKTYVCVTKARSATVRLPKDRFRLLPIGRESVRKREL